MAIVTANLVAEWVAKLATGSGPGVNSPSPTTTWADNVGSNDITLQNTGGNFAWNDSGSGWDGNGTSGDPYCLCADGTGDYGTFDSSPVTSDSDFSCEVWTYVADKPTANSWLLTCHASNTGFGYYVPAGGRGTWRMGTGSGYTYSEDYVWGGSNNGYGAAWQQHVLCYDASENTLTQYRNGTLSRTDVTSTAFSPNTGTCYLFRSTTGMNAMKIAAVRIYSACLSSDDVSANYNSGVLAASTDARNLAARLPFLLRISAPKRAESGSYVLTGADADMLRDYVLAAAAGSYTITGAAAELSKLGNLAARLPFLLRISAPKSYELTVDTGAYAVTGSSVEWAWHHILKLSVDSGSYTLTGNAAGLTVARKLSVDTGAYAVTGSSVEWAWHHILIAISAAYALSGADASVTRGGIVSAESASYAITGQDIDYALDNLPGLQSMLAFWMGGSVGPQHLTLIVHSRDWTITGHDVQLRRRPYWGVSPAAPLNDTPVRTHGEPRRRQDVPVARPLRNLPRRQDGASNARPRRTVTSADRRR